MLPLLIGAAVLGSVLYTRHKKPASSGVLTPARAQVHGNLMRNEWNPQKLDKAAQLFRKEGLGFQARDLSGKAAQLRKQLAVVCDLVERSRALDQNALGMIAAIREQAARNDPRAIVSANMIAKYCAARPPRRLGPLGETPTNEQAAS